MAVLCRGVRVWRVGGRWHLGRVLRHHDNRRRGRHGRAAALAALVAPAPAGLKLEVAVVEVRVIACRPLPVAARASGPARGGVSGRGRSLAFPARRPCAPISQCASARGSPPAPPRLQTRSGPAFIPAAIHERAWSLATRVTRLHCTPVHHLHETLTGGVLLS